VSFNLAHPVETSMFLD